MIEVSPETGNEPTTPAVTPFSTHENSANNTFIGQVLLQDHGQPNKTLTLDVDKTDIRHWITRGDAFETIPFSASFSEPPVVLSQIQGDGDYNVSYHVQSYSYTGKRHEKGHDFLFRTRQQLATTTGVDIILETDLDTKGSSVVTAITDVESPEPVGWLAISQADFGLWGEHPFEVILTDETIRGLSNTAVSLSAPFYEQPKLFTQLATTNDKDQSGVGISNINSSVARVFVDEIDDEQHDPEAIGLMLLQGAGNLLANDGTLIA